MVNDLALMGFDENTKRMTLLALNPGVALEQVKENTGFELTIPEKVDEKLPPPDEELHVLRKEIDLTRVYI
jgi:glutaconate CoA-transferase subunit B